jgi:hypothetical protein
VVRGAVIDAVGAGCRCARPGSDGRPGSAAARLAHAPATRAGSAHRRQIRVLEILLRDAEVGGHRATLRSGLLPPQATIRWGLDGAGPSVNPVEGDGSTARQKSMNLLLIELFPAFRWRIVLALAWPVTPEVAGSSPVAPAENILQIRVFCCQHRRRRPPASGRPPRSFRTGNQPRA